jgi:hypothetical protein
MPGRLVLVIGAMSVTLLGVAPVGAQQPPVDVAKVTTEVKAKVDNTRYKKDGSVMSVGGVTYLLGGTKEGWRIVSYTGHPKEKVVRCN